MISCAFYGRYSSERQTEQSIEGQFRICQEYANANNLKIVKQYVDRAMTGRNDDRADFQQMLYDAEHNAPWDVVLVYAIDRFGRNAIEIAINKQRLQKHGKVLISATQRTSDNIDGTKNLDGILLENVYIGLAEYYSAELSQKVKRGQYESRLKGQFIGGNVPYGYTVKDKHLVPKEDEAEIVRYIFEQAAAEKVTTEIINDLTNRGVLYKGKPFRKTMVYAMLRSDRFIGLYHYKGETFTNRYPAIVDKTIFDKVQHIIDERRDGKKRRDADFLLRNKVKCGKCGKNMSGESGCTTHGVVHYYYKCAGQKQGSGCTTKPLKKEAFEKKIIGICKNILLNEETLNYFADQIIIAHDKILIDNSVLNILLSQEKEIKTALSNLMKAIEAGIFTDTTKQRLVELENNLTDIKAKIVFEENKLQKHITKNEVLNYLHNIPIEDTKTLIRLLIKVIIVYEDKILLVFNYSNTPDTDDYTSEQWRALFISRIKSKTQQYRLPKRYR